MFIIVVLIVGVVLFVGFLVLASEKMFMRLPRGWDSVSMGFGIVGSIVVGLLLIILIVCGLCYNGAKYKADVINRAYDTSYTTNEIFWTGDVIDTVREIQRDRSESTINLNINEE